MTEYETDSESGDGELRECPTCGRDDFASPRGVKLHHAKTHGESIAGVAVECAWCGDEKMVRPAVVNEYDHHFCDDNCKGAWQEVNMVGEDAGNWQGGPVVEPCDNCGEDVERKRAVAEDCDKAFCDFECRGEWRAEHWVGEANPNYDRVSVDCGWCGDEVLVTQSWIDGRESTYCSEECYNAARSEKYSGDGNPMHGLYGEDHPAWVDGRFSYGEGWDDPLKERVRESQDRYCASCGTHESVVGETLHVHHIQKARSFDDPEERNDESNLVALCRDCHRTWEKMSPLRPQTPHAD